MLNFPIQLLVATAIAAVIGMSGLLINNTPIPEAEVRLESNNQLVKIGDTFKVSIIVESTVPVNVFKGFISFNAGALQVAAIDYNTSIANLWAEEPWYSNGDGTINFTGGTTQSNGFLGTGTLITITFKAKQIGESRVAMDEIRILKHDGLGTEISVKKPIDTIFAIENERLAEQTLLNTALAGPVITIVTNVPLTDLNRDGKQNVADVSIFMTDFVSQNLRSDFNEDGIVTLKDLSILTR